MPRPEYFRVGVKLAALALLTSFISNAGAALPATPRFVINPPSGADLTTLGITKFDFMCKAGLQNTDDASTFTLTASVTPAQPIVYPVMHTPPIGTFADGGWTCFAKTFAANGTSTPTNRVSFSVQKPVAPPVFSLTVD
jgi:hypothetical protein